VTSQIGWAKIAFQHAFYYLKNETTYDVAIKEILSKGGDTDTNAAIVGGLLGAAWGISSF
jgi:ADP-ribosyl-[dinitrogen reductase] hydrolase